MLVEEKPGNLCPSRTCVCCGCWAGIYAKSGIQGHGSNNQHNPHLKQHSEIDLRCGTKCTHRMDTVHITHCDARGAMHTIVYKAKGSYAPSLCQQWQYEPLESFHTIF
eukprot:scaffold192914_cov18-Tisochrysis_lutea.AAC.1